MGFANSTQHIVVLDLGGVIIRLGDHIFPSSWFAESKIYDLQTWLQADLAKAFETGRVDAKEFGMGIKQELRLDQSVDEILAMFAAWPESFFDGATALLDALREDYYVVALSNINELHAPRMLDEFQLHRRMDRLFFSHELGVSKPDPAIFKHLVTELQAKPEQITFFDDVQANVAAAQTLGMAAHRVDGPKQILSLLNSSV